MSEGHFTVSLPDALRKLGTHQLSNPRTYLLKLIQWAVASHPTFVRVQVTAKHVIVAHDGESPREADARRLPFPGLSESLDHLAVGIRAGLALGATTAHISAPGWGVDLGTGKSIESTMLNQAILFDIKRPIARMLAIRFIEGLAGVTLIGLFVAAWTNSTTDGIGAGIITATLETGGLSWSFINDAPGLLSPEVSLARFRCAYSDVPIYLNRKPVNKPYFGLASTYRMNASALEANPTVKINPSRCFATEEPDCRLPWLGGSESATRLPHLMIEGQTCRGYRSIALRELPGKHGYGTSKISWIKDGVIVAEETQAAWPVGFRIVACAHDLKVDVSQFALVHDERYLLALNRVLRALTLEGPPFN